MIKIAIIEDQQEDAQLLSHFIQKYSEEENVLFEIKHFSNGMNFLDEYDSKFHIIYLDIQKNFLTLRCYSRRISKTPFMHIRWQRDATRSVLWRSL